MKWPQDQPLWLKVLAGSFIAFCFVMMVLIRLGAFGDNHYP